MYFKYQSRISNSVESEQMHRQHKQLMPSKLKLKVAKLVTSRLLFVVLYRVKFKEGSNTFTPVTWFFGPTPLSNTLLRPNTSRYTWRIFTGVGEGNNGVFIRTVQTLVSVGTNSAESGLILSYTMMYQPIAHNLKHLAGRGTECFFIPLLSTAEHDYGGLE